MDLIWIDIGFFKISMNELARPIMGTIFLVYNNAKHHSKVLFGINNSEQFFIQVISKKGIYLRYIWLFCCFMSTKV